MRLLVTGAGGQLGRDLVACAEQAGDEVVACDHTRLDVTDRDAVLGAITSLRPHAVVHAAAWTAVDACEGDPDRALAVNGLAVRWMAEACRRAGSHLVTISTDYVFSGEEPDPYVEWDLPRPLSAYGRSKLAGEREALDAGIGATVVRTSWVCGEHGSNMVRTILRLLDQGHHELSFVDDQRGHPTLTADLAPMLRRLAVDRRPGVHHVTNQGAVSWCDFAREVVQLVGRSPEMVRPITTAELQPPRPAPRPANSVLDNAVLRMSGLGPLPDFRESLGGLVHRLRA